MCVLGGLLLTALLVLCVADKESKPAKRHPNRGQYLKGAWVTCTFTLADVILQTSVIKNLVWLDFGLLCKNELLLGLTWALGNMSRLFPLDFDYLETKKPCKKARVYTAFCPMTGGKGCSLYMTLNWLSERKWTDGGWRANKKKKKTFSKLINTEKSLLLQSVYTSKHSDPQ